MVISWEALIISSKFSALSAATSSTKEIEYNNKREDRNRAYKIIMIRLIKGNKRVIHLTLREIHAPSGQMLHRSRWAPWDRNGDLLFIHVSTFRRLKLYLYAIIMIIIKHHFATLVEKTFFFSKIILFPPGNHAPCLKKTSPCVHSLLSRSVNVLLLEKKKKIREQPPLVAFLLFSSFILYKEEDMCSMLFCCTNFYSICISAL